MSIPTSPIVLASRSPRRAALLRLLGVDYDLIDIDIDERPLRAETSVDYVQRVALAKAACARAGGNERRIVLAADTCVSVDGDIYGKPLDFADARRMLRRLGGGWHTVHTAVVVAGVDGPPQTVVVATRVEFIALDDAIIAAYWASGEPADKAGAYGIQGLGGALVRRIEGSYSAVVGLPLAETAALLASVGVAHALTGRA